MIKDSDKDYAIFIRVILDSSIITENVPLFFRFSNILLE